MAIITSKSAQAQVRQSVALFHEARRNASFRNLMTGPAPGRAREMARRGEPVVTAPGYPIVRLDDLRKMRGERVTVDMESGIYGQPTMGNDMLAGNADSLSFDHHEFRIDYYRHAVEPGTARDQQYTSHELKPGALMALGKWAGRMDDLILLVNLSGARGSAPGHDWGQIPSLDLDDAASVARFNKVMVNPVTAPTANRHFFPNDATSLTNIDSGDYLTLGGIDRIRAQMDAEEFPIPPIQIPEYSQQLGEENLYCLFVGPMTFYYLRGRVDAAHQQTYQQWVAEATQRRGMYKHWLFKAADTLFWNGMLVRKMKRCVTFKPGDKVRQAENLTTPADWTADAQEETVTVNSNLSAAAGDRIERCLLVGAHAIGSAYGRDGDSMLHARWTQETSDHGFRTEFGLRVCCGTSKMRMKQDATGMVTDHGVAVVDCYAPLANSANGRTLAQTLNLN